MYKRGRRAYVIRQDHHQIIVVQRAECSRHVGERDKTSFVPWWALGPAAGSGSFRFVRLLRRRGHWNRGPLCHGGCCWISGSLTRISSAGIFFFCSQLPTTLSLSSFFLICLSGPMIGPVLLVKLRIQFTTRHHPTLGQDSAAVCCSSAEMEVRNGTLGC